MKRLTIALAVIAVLSFSSLIATPVQAQVYRSPHTKPGGAADTITFQRVTPDIAPSALQKGDIDLYIFFLRASAARALVGSPGIQLYSAPSSLVNFILNPAPKKDPSDLNPFTSQRLRWALNFVVNRDLLVKEIYGGLASPMVTHLSSFDFDFTVIFDIIAKNAFRYDPGFAAGIVDEEMTKLGARKIGGKWTFGGKPVIITGIIRVEDERREMGDAFAAELEKLGFTVERKFLTFGPAINAVYGTDPQDFEWTFYTEGWGKTGADKYDAGSVNQFIAPWQGFMPGWQETGFWQFEHKKADEIGQKIFNGQFRSKAERDQLYRQLTEIGIDLSIRLWGATALSTNPARKELTGVTNDIGAGLRAAFFNARNMYVPGRTDVKVGHLWVWTERTVWNPVAGFLDVYSVDIARATWDPVVWVDPFVGGRIPFRGGFSVATAGPDGKLDVPADSFLWNNRTKAFEAVGAGKKATSKVTYDLSKYTRAKWHHGQSITMGDILYDIAQLWDNTFDTAKSGLEPATAAANKPVLDTIRGYRIADENTLEVYVDFWHFDDNFIADFAVTFLGSANPWEMLAAQDDLVFAQKKAAYSQTAARRFNVLWLNLVLKEHAQLVADTLTALKTRNFFPANFMTAQGRTWFNQADAPTRYDAALKWFTDKKHMWISDGPYFLQSFDAQAQFAEIRAFRDTSYPFRAGAFFFGLPQPVQIVTVGKPSVVPGGDSTFIIELDGPGSLAVKYLIRDTATEEILVIGDGTKLSPKRFGITLPASLTAKLKAGSLYELTVAGFSDSVAFVASAREFFDVLNITPIQRGIESGLKGVSDDLTKRLGDVSKDLASAITALSTDVKTVNTNLNQRIDGVSSTLTARIDTVSSSVRDVTARVDSVSTRLSSQLEALSATASTTLTVAQVVLALSAIAIIVSLVAVRRK